MGLKLNGTKYGVYLNGQEMGGYVNGVQMFGKFPLTDPWHLQRIQGVVSQNTAAQWRTASTFGSLRTGTDKWRGGVLAPNGKIYGIPRNSTAVLEISTTNAFTNFDTQTLLSAYLNKL